MTEKTALLTPSSRMLFDITDIDLDKVIATSEDLERINPQQGDMRQLDYVIYLDDDCTEGIGVKDIRDDEFWVPGHIPGRPLFPGVLQIEAAAARASSTAARPETPSSASRA